MRTVTATECQAQIKNLLNLIDSEQNEGLRQELEYEKDVLFAELYLIQFPDDDDGECF